MTTLSDLNKPSYDDWIAQLAQAYAGNTVVNGDPLNASVYGYQGAPQSGTNNAQAMAQLAQQFGGSDTLHGLYNQGVTANQVLGQTPQQSQIGKDAGLLQQLNAWDESDNHAGQDLPPELQAAIASGDFTKGDGSSWSLSATSPGQAQADALKTNGLADYSLNGSANYKDPGAFGYNPATGSLATAASNIDPGSKYAEMAYWGIPALGAALFTGPALGAAGAGLLDAGGDAAAGSSFLSPSTLMKIPGIINSVSNSSNPGSSAINAILGAAAPAIGGAAGAPSWLSSLLPSLINGGGTTLQNLLQNMNRSSPNGKP